MDAEKLISSTGDMALLHSDSMKHMGYNTCPGLSIVSTVDTDIATGCSTGNMALLHSESVKQHRVNNTCQGLSAATTMNTDISTDSRASDSLYSVSCTSSSLCTISMALDTSSVCTNVGLVSTTINSMHSNVSPASTAISPMCATVSSVNSTISPVNCTISSVNSTISPVNSTISPVNSTISSVNSTISSVNSTISPVNSTISPVNSTISPVNCTISSVNSTISPVNSTISPVNSTISSVNSTISPVNSTISPVNSTISSVNSTISPVNSTISSVNSIISPVISTISPVNSTISPVNSPISSVNSTISPVNSTISPVNSTISSVNSTISPVNSTISPVNSPISPVNSIISPVNSTISPVNSTVSPVNSTISPVNSTISPVNSTISPVNSTISPVNSTISSVNSIISPVNSTISSVNSTISSVNSTISPVNSTISSVNSTISPVNSTISSVNSTISPVNSTISPVNSTISSVNSTISPINSTISSVNSTISPVNSTISSVNSIISPVNSTISPVNSPTSSVSIAICSVSASSVISTVHSTTVDTTTTLDISSTASSPVIPVCTQSLPEQKKYPQTLYLLSLPKLVSIDKGTLQSHPAVQSKTSDYHALRRALEPQAGTTQTQQAPLALNADGKQKPTEPKCNVESVIDTSEQTTPVRHTVVTGSELCSDEDQDDSQLDEDDPFEIVFACGLCDKIFADGASLELHIVSKDCPKLDKKFQDHPTDTAEVSSNAIHTSECNKDASDSETVSLSGSDTMSLSDSENVSLEMEVFKEETEIDYNKQGENASNDCITEESEFVCWVCDATFADGTSLELHIWSKDCPKLDKNVKDHPTDSAEVSSNTIHASECNKVASDSETVSLSGSDTISLSDSENVSLEMEVFKEDTEIDYSKQGENASNDCITEESEFVCGICDATFADEKSLELHIWSRDCCSLGESDKDTVDVSSTCIQTPECNKKTSDSEAVSPEIEVLKEESETDNIKQGENASDDCVTKVFESNEPVRGTEVFVSKEPVRGQDISTSAGEIQTVLNGLGGGDDDDLNATYGCGICGKEFRGESDLTGHIQEVHILAAPLPCEMEAEYTCGMCQQMFKDCSTLEKHLTMKECIASKVVPEESFICGKCDRSFSVMEHLMDHMKTECWLSLSNSVQNEVVDTPTVATSVDHISLQTGSERRSTRLHKNVSYFESSDIDSDKETQHDQGSNGDVNRSEVNKNQTPAAVHAVVTTGDDSNFQRGNGERKESSLSIDPFETMAEKTVEKLAARVAKQAEPESVTRSSDTAGNNETVPKRRRRRRNKQQVIPALQQNSDLLQVRNPEQFDKYVKTRYADNFPVEPGIPRPNYPAHITMQGQNATHDYIPGTYPSAGQPHMGHLPQTWPNQCNISTPLSQAALSGIYSHLYTSSGQISGQPAPSAAYVESVGGKQLNQYPQHAGVSYGQFSGEQYPSQWSHPNHGQWVEPANGQHNSGILGQISDPGQQEMITLGTNEHIPVAREQSPETMNQRQTARDQRPFTMDQRQMTMDQRPFTMDQRQMTMEQRQQAMDPRPFTMDPRQMTMDQRPFTMDQRQMTMEQRQQAMDPRPFTMDPRQMTMEQRQTARDQRPFTMDPRQVTMEQMQTARDQRPFTMDPRQMTMEQMQTARDQRPFTMDPRHMTMEQRQLVMEPGTDASVQRFEASQLLPVTQQNAETMKRQHTGHQAEQVVESVQHMPGTGRDIPFVTNHRREMQNDPISSHGHAMQKQNDNGYHNFRPWASFPQTNQLPGANAAVYRHTHPDVNAPLYKQTHPEANIPENTQTCPNINTSAYTQTHPNVNTQTYTQTHPNINTPTYTQTHPSANTPAYTQTHPNVNTPTYTQTHPNVNTPTYTQTHPNVNTPTYPQTNPNVNTAYPHTHPSANIPAYIHTHPATDVPANTQSHSFTGPIGKPYIPDTTPQNNSLLIAGLLGRDIATKSDVQNWRQTSVSDASPCSVGSFYTASNAPTANPVVSRASRDVSTCSDVPQVQSSSGTVQTCHIDQTLASSSNLPVSATVNSSNSASHAGKNSDLIKGTSREPMSSNHSSSTVLGEINRPRKTLPPAMDRKVKSTHEAPTEDKSLEKSESQSTISSSKSTEELWTEADIDFYRNRGKSKEPKEFNQNIGVFCKYCKCTKIFENTTDAKKHFEMCFRILTDKRIIAKTRWPPVENMYSARTATKTHEELKEGIQPCKTQTTAKQTNEGLTVTTGSTQMPETIIDAPSPNKIGYVERKKTVDVNKKGNHTNKVQTDAEIWTEAATSSLSPVVGKCKEVKQKSSKIYVFCKYCKCTKTFEKITDAKKHFEVCVRISTGAIKENLNKQQSKTSNDKVVKSKENSEDGNSLESIPNDVLKSKKNSGDGKDSESIPNDNVLKSKRNSGDGNSSESIPNDVLKSKKNSGDGKGSESIPNDVLKSKTNSGDEQGLSGILNVRRMVEETSGANSSKAETRDEEGSYINHVDVPSIFESESDSSIKAIVIQSSSDSESEDSDCSGYEEVVLDDDELSSPVIQDSSGHMLPETSQIDAGPLENQLKASNCTKSDSTISDARNKTLPRSYGAKTKGKKQDKIRKVPTTYSNTWKSRLKKKLKMGREMKVQMKAQIALSKALRKDKNQDSLSSECVGQRMTRMQLLRADASKRCETRQQRKLLESKDVYAKTKFKGIKPMQRQKLIRKQPSVLIETDNDSDTNTGSHPATRVDKVENRDNIMKDKFAHTVAGEKEKTHSDNAMKLSADDENYSSQCKYKRNKINHGIQTKRLSKNKNSKGNKHCKRQKLETETDSSNSIHSSNSIYENDTSSEDSEDYSTLSRFKRIKVNHKSSKKSNASIGKNCKRRNLTTISVNQCSETDSSSTDDETDSGKSKSESIKMNLRNRKNSMLRKQHAQRKPDKQIFDSKEKSDQVSPTSITRSGLKGNIKNPKLNQESSSSNGAPTAKGKLAQSQDDKVEDSRNLRSYRKADTMSSIIGEKPTKQQMTDQSRKQSKTKDNVPDDTHMRTMRAHHKPTGLVKSLLFPEVRLDRMMIDNSELVGSSEKTTKTTIDSGPSFECGECRESFQTLEDLTGHINSHSFMIAEKSVNVPKPEVTPPENDAQFICGICKIGLSSAVELTEHMQFHLMEDKFVCGVCQRTFSVASALENHFQEHLTVNEEFLCGICRQCFPSAELLEFHMSTHSNNFSTVNVVIENSENNMNDNAMVESKVTTGRDDDLVNIDVDLTEHTVNYRKDSVETSFKENRNKSLNSKNKMEKVRITPEEENAKENSSLRTPVNRLLSETARKTWATSVDKTKSAKNVEISKTNKQNVDKIVVQDKERTSGRVGKGTSGKDVSDDVVDKVVGGTADVEASPANKAVKDETMKPSSSTSNVLSKLLNYNISKLCK